MRNRNTGRYTVAELDELMKPFRFLAYEEARGQNEADVLAFRILGVGKRDARALAREVENLFQPLFPKLAIGIRGVTGKDRMIVNIGNGESWNDLTRPQFALAAQFEKELVKYCENNKLKVVSTHDPKYTFIPTGYVRPK